MKLYLERDNVKIPVIMEMPKNCKSFVLLCHGTGSEKNEVGNMFETLALKLAEKGIGSIRMDFADCGERIEYNEKVSFLGQVYDVMTCYKFVCNFVDKDKIGILGFSQGARIMAEFIRLEKNMQYAISWSGACLDGISEFQSWFDEYYEDAKKKGYANLELGFRKPLCLSIDWFEEIKNTTPLKTLHDYKNPIFVVAGTNDTSVPYQHSFEIINTSYHPASKILIVEEADHIFNIFSDDSKADYVIDQTIKWIETVI